MKNFNNFTLSDFEIIIPKTVNKSDILWNWAYTGWVVDDFSLSTRNVYTLELSPSGASTHLLIEADKTSKIPATITRMCLHLLRKEYVYTKLKYSRSPALDIASGGSAALLAAFLGFLISEKFGIELVDSGDFYYLNMYGVILAYALKTFKDLICISQSFFQFITLYYLREFYILLFTWFLYLPLSVTLSYFKGVSY